MGGATAKIGDPSGKSKERPILDESTIIKNSNSLAISIQRIFRNYNKHFAHGKMKILPERYCNLVFSLTCNIRFGMALCMVFEKFCWIGIIMIEPINLIVLIGS